MFYWRTWLRSPQAVVFFISRSGMFIPDLIFIFPGSRVLVSRSNNSNKRGEKILFYLSLLPQISQNLKLLHFWAGTVQKTGANSQRWKNYTTFYQKSSQKYGFQIWDPRSQMQGLKRLRIPDPQPCQKDVGLASSPTTLPRRPAGNSWISTV